MKKIFFLFAGIALLASCKNNSASGGDSDRLSKMKARTQAFYDKVMTGHNVALIDSFCSPDYVEHTTDPGYPPTRDGLKKNFTDLFAAFPDLKIKVNFMVADSDKVVTYYTFTGTNSGPMMGMKATNKTVSVNGVDILTIKNGMATEHWDFNDQMAMMMQLGLMPDGSKSDSTKNGDDKMKTDKMK